MCGGTTCEETLNKLRPHNSKMKNELNQSNYIVYLGLALGLPNRLAWSIAGVHLSIF